ncbi:sodium/potassium-transporting ATPase subunit beta-1-like [Leptopilina heterotoma]|uniref:sodium/potassium-transporting ATPase subunit beta-1-like n=1 Tax=Leptopilina heterotoma TaxID=63436 RepID=UPI001CA8F99B|nr:sodium/potassium-transporting ATPase subunit beta-1-like [Leptopilina heterotoma]
MSIPGKLVTNGVYEFSYMRPVDTRTKWQKFKDGIYNRKENTLFGHTKYEWGRTGLFYLVFFSVLAAFFAICMKGLLATLNEDKPRWILENSIIGTSPGMGFRPISNDLKDEMVISYDTKNSSDINIWIQKLDLFLSSYHNSSLLLDDGRNQQICNYDALPHQNKVCMFDVDTLGPCSYGQGYGFATGKPCVFLKLNKIFSWIPKLYDDPQKLPTKMPERLKQHIQNTDINKMKNIWVSCKSLNQPGNSTLNEIIDYYPKIQGFPGYFYPYENQPGYLSPLIAVQFTNFRKNAVIEIECQAWAKNIKDEDDADGKAYRVRFSLKIIV